MKATLLFFVALSAATPAAAQVRPPAPPPRRVLPPLPAPPRTFRVFALVSAERFMAHDTFDATLGRAIQPMFGGGVQFAFRNRTYIDVTVSRLQKTGDRAFVFQGQGFPLGIPLDVSLTPIEGTFGRRFAIRSSPGIVPYVGAGGGLYLYKESSSGDDFTASKAGALAVGGVEFRVSRVVRVSADAQYTYVPGILGKGGVSLDAGEKDLGGVAARVRVVFGK